MRGVQLALAILMLVSITGMGAAADQPNFELLFSGHGDIASYIYFKQDLKFLIDTELNVSVEMIRYKKLFITADLFEETAMGRKPRLESAKTDMIFDPNRGHWSFGFTGRLELPRHFIESQFHHDCFHDIDRYENNSIYWNSLRFGFGDLGFLPKYRYHQPVMDKAAFFGPNKINYYLLSTFFFPRGHVWQKNHDYQFTLNTDLHYLFFRYKKFGINIDSNNLWVINSAHDLKRQHELTLDFGFYGSRGAFLAYLGWWPYDDQSIRSRDGRTVFGIHFAF